MKQELIKLLERRVFNVEELVDKIDQLYKQEQNNLKLKHTQALYSNCQKVLEEKIKQDKKMYSEEDMDNYAEYCINHFAKSQIGQPYLSAKEWFEQIKEATEL